MSTSQYNAAHGVASTSIADDFMHRYSKIDSITTRRSNIVRGALTYYSKCNHAAHTPTALFEAMSDAVMLAIWKWKIINGTLINLIALLFVTSENEADVGTIVFVTISTISLKYHHFHFRTDALVIAARWRAERSPDIKYREGEKYLWNLDFVYGQETAIWLDSHHISLPDAGTAIFSRAASWRRSKAWSDCWRQARLRQARNFTPPEMALCRLRRRMLAPASSAPRTACMS